MKLYSNKYNYCYKIITIILISLLLTSCYSSSNNTIDGADLGKSSENFDETMKQFMVVTLEDKYKRHFQNNLYYEDLSKEQKELNKLYNQYLNKEIQNYIQIEIPELKNAPYILKTNIEYVNEDVKKYSNGQLKAEEIIDNGNSMMSIKIQWYIFEDFYKLKETKEENEKLGEKLAIDYIERKIGNKYILQGLESIQINARAYPKETLKKYSIDEIEKQDNIQIFLQEEGEKSSFEANMYRTYFSDGLSPDRKFKSTGGLIYPKDFYKKRKQELKEKYNMEFYEAEGLYIPKDYPNIRFYADGTTIEIDHFKEAFYQYLMNEKVRKLIQEKKLEDRVVFLVTTEAQGDPYEDDNSVRKPYNFGKGFDKEFFLKQGYTGKVYTTFIYLDDYVEESEEDKFDEEKRNQESERREECLQKLRHELVYPLHEEIQFGYSKLSYDGELGLKIAYLYLYDAKEYDRKIIIDLFKKHPLTEVDRMPELGFDNVFSLLYYTRSETPGFRYIDIFTKHQADSGEVGEFDGGYEEAVEKGEYIPKDKR